MALHYRFRTAVLPGVIALTSCSNARQSSVQYELSYGTTQYVPMTDRPAHDYLPDDVHLVPAVIRRCGARFVGFNGNITDGGEAAYFDVDPDRSSANECIKKAFPQAAVRIRT